MKKVVLWGLALSSMTCLVVACSNVGNTTVAVTVGATVSAGSNDNFVPAQVTITHGQSVVWDSSVGSGSHTVQIDSFSGSTVPGAGCGTTTNYTSFPITIAFPTAGTYYYHCTNHSNCGTSGCGLCAATPGATTGFGNMVGSVVVN
jgi:plastocyanin